MSKRQHDRHERDSSPKRASHRHHEDRESHRRTERNDERHRDDRPRRGGSRERKVRAPERDEFRDQDDRPGRDRPGDGGDRPRRGGHLRRDELPRLDPGATHADRPGPTGYRDQDDRPGQLSRDQLEAMIREEAGDLPARPGSSSARPPEQPEQPDAEEKTAVVKETVNFAASGKLAEDTNLFNGVIVAYSEPAEAKKPSKKWRLYPFKGEQPLPHIEIHKQSAFLLGRDRRVVDIAIDHPSCSKQHAALQYRVVPYEKPDGTTGRRIRPYLMDLGSGNGSFINSQRLEPRRYYELFEKDVIKFGFSSREYVVLTEETKDQ